MSSDRWSLTAAARREQRTAYFLVAPTLIVVALVAVYPLGSGMIKSFTDETFASDQPPRFIGPRNYSSLLGVTFRLVHPLPDTANGAVTWPKPEDVLPRYELYRLSQDALTTAASRELSADTVARLRPLLTKEYPGKAALAKAVSDAAGPREEQAAATLSDLAVRRVVRYSVLGQLSLPGSRLVIGAQNPVFYSAILNTVVFTIVTVCMEAILGTLLALALQRRFRGRGALRALMLVPWAIPTAISSRMWAWMFNSTRTGFFNVILQALGLGNGQVPFLELQAAQLPIMWVIDVWKTTPFMTLLILAGLQLIPAELNEAAAVDGVTGPRRFWQITLPLLRPTLAVALVFRTLDALRVFDLFQIVLGESRYSMASFTYYQLIQNRAAGYSAASGVVIFVIIFCFAVSYVRALGLQAPGDQE